MTTFKNNLHNLQGQAEDRAADDAKRRLAKALSPPAPGMENRQGRLSRRWAKVTGTNTNGTVNVSIDGATVANVICLASYTPTVGDPVILDFLGEDPLVIGTPATGTNSSGVQPGTILDYGGGTMPGGYLGTNGAAVSRTTYAALFAAIGTAWGAGDGSTTFNVPDIRGQCTIGAGTGTGLTARALAGSGGEETHVLSTAELAVHSHTNTLNDPGHAHVTDWATAAGSTRHFMPESNGTLSGQTTGDPVLSGTSGVTITNANAGSGTAHNNMQPYRVVTKMIKF